MATVTKDFRIKSGLVVEGTNATVNGSDLITEDIITGGTQTNIAVTYDAQNKVLNFVAENGVADSTTDNLAEGTANRYFTEARARAAVSDGAGISYNSTTGEISVEAGEGLTFGGVNTTTELVINRNTVDTWYDENGAAAEALEEAKDYTDTAIEGISTTLNVSDGGNSEQINLATDTLTFANGNSSPVLPVLSNDTVSFDFLAGDTLFMNGGYLEVNVDQVASTIYNGSIDSGIETSSGPTRIKVKPGDGITLNSSGVSVDTGRGLEIDGQGKLAVEAGSGILVDDIDAGNGVAVDLSYVAENIYSNMSNSGLEHEGGSSKKLRVKAGNGIELTTEGVSVNTGYGLEFDGSGQLAVNNGYGITTFNQDVAVDLTTIAGDLAGFGLESGMMNNLSVKPGNGINVDTNFGSSVEVALADDSGLEFDDGDLKVNLGDHLIVNGNGLSLNTTALAGSGLAIEPGFENQTGKLKVDTSTIATKQYVDDEIASLVDGAPELLDTLNELAAAINDDENFSATVTTSIGTKVSKAGDTMTGELVLAADPTQNLAAATKQYVDNELDGYLNSTSGSEGTTILYVQDYVATAIETGDATATPTYLAIDYNSIATQVAGTASSTGAGEVIVYSFNAAEFRSAKFLVKIASGSHTQVSEVLLTLDASNNIAITEYAIVGTNGSLGDVGANVSSGTVNLTVDVTGSGTNISVAGTLLA